MSIQMFCLPYAGGSSSIYYDWKTEFEPLVKIEPLEYAGRGKRFCEEYFKSIKEAAEDLSDKIIQRQRGDYVIYGHSMGCLVALETAFCLVKKNAVLPKAVIIAATRPPHLMDRDKALEKLSKDELMREIASMGQMEKEIMEDKEMYDIVADIMYADIQMYRAYKRHYSDGKLDIPLLALTGNDDSEAPEEDMKEWQLYTNGKFEYRKFEGNHFFAFNGGTIFRNYILDYIKRLA